MLIMCKEIKVRLKILVENQKFKIKKEKENMKRKFRSKRYYN